MLKAITGNSVRERQEIVARIRIRHPQLNAAIRLIEDCWERRARGASEHYNVAIAGYGGTGKSEVRKTFAEKHPREEGPEASIQRVAQVELISSARGAFAQGLVDSIEEPLIVEGNSIGAKIRAFKIQAPKIGLGVLLIDEMHLLIHGNKFIRDVAVDIRALINATNLMIVLLGLPNMLRIFEERQTERRFVDPMHLTPFSWTNMADRQAFLKFLDLFDAALPFDVRSALADTALGFAFYQGSSGVLDYMVNIVREAADEAIKDGSPCIERSHLALAYDLIVGARHPFAKLKGGAGYNPFIEERSTIDSVVAPGILTLE